MYNDTLENWIELDAHHRIAIRRDDTGIPVNPVAEMEGEVGCWTLRMARGYNGLFEVDDEIAGGIRNVIDTTESDNYRDLETEVIDYLEREHGLTVLSLSMTGYSQGEWMDVLLWTKARPDEGGEPVARNVLSHVARDLTCWFRGDVYTLSVEELVTYYGPNDKYIERWELVEDVDTVFQNYFDSRPDIDDILNRLEIDLADYGVTDDSKLELVK